MRLIFCILIFTQFACNSNRVNDQALERTQGSIAGIVKQSPKKYFEIKSGLYRDSSFNIYFKVFDVSNSPTQPEERYLEVAYSDLFASDGKRKLKDVVDTTTFKELGGGYYKDRNLIFIHNVMADGGTLVVVEEADVNTFEAFTWSWFAVDKKHCFYKGEILKDADRNSFKPLKVKNMAWYAQDKNHFYEGEYVMNDAEVVELQKLLD